MFHVELTELIPTITLISTMMKAHFGDTFTIMA